MFLLLPDVQQPFLNFQCCAFPPPVFFILPAGTNLTDFPPPPHPVHSDPWYLVAPSKTMLCFAAPYQACLAGKFGSQKPPTGLQPLPALQLFPGCGVYGRGCFPLADKHLVLRLVAEPPFPLAEPLVAMVVCHYLGRFVLGF